MGDNFMPKNADNHMPKLNDHICSNSIHDYTNQVLPNGTNGYNGVTNGYMSSTTDTFRCYKCKFTCSKESNWKLHLNTRKHNHADNFNSNSSNYACECGKTYKHRQGLSRHKKKCSIILDTHETLTASSNNEIDHASLTEKMIELVMSKNQEFMNVFMDKIVHMLPSITNTNCHNTNNQFNIQMFLNDHCKNAMNISDFIKSLPITAQHYENTKDNGLADTLTNIMVDGLNNLDIVERPIHCTDKKRKVMYVKDDDKWEKDDNNNLILKNLKDLSFLHGQNLELWQEKNPNYETVEKLQIEFTNIIGELYTNILEERKHVNKIINNLTNSTYLDDDTKDQYKK